MTKGDPTWLTKAFINKCFSLYVFGAPKKMTPLAPPFRLASMSMVAVLVGLLLLLVAGGAEAATRWHQLEGYTPEHYVQEFRRRYSAEEKSARHKLLAARLEEIRR
eukprot:RCo019018